MKEIGQQFIELTKYLHSGPSPQMKGEPAPPLEMEYNENDLIALPDPKRVHVRDITLNHAIDSRESVRDYSEESLTLDELSYLLWTTQGVKKVYKGAATFRTVPSAGSRHAIETFLLINNVTSLEKGLYRFVATRHSLVPVNLNEEIGHQLMEACFNQKMVGLSAVTLFWGADIYRMTWRYGERSYRYILLDVGHACQNLYLAVQSIGCGTCAIAAFDDDSVNNLLGIDGEHLFMIYCATVGKL